MPGDVSESGSMRFVLRLLIVVLLLSSTACGPGMSRLPDVPAARLPADAQATLRLINAGGPFPYRQDGVVFANREGRLPAEPSGYYREYTVPTPGSPDRGARRIVVGKNGEHFYTADHYRSFERVTE